MKWPVFIISLPDAEERRGPLVRMLDQLQISHELIPAIDGRNSLPREYEQFIDRDLARARLGRDMTDGEFACALSHQQVYKRILSDGLPGAIVLEDDALVEDLFHEFCSEVNDIGCDFLQLDYNWARVWRFGIGRKRLSKRIETRPLLYNCGLATGYALNSRAAEYIQSNSQPLSLPADWPCDLSPMGPRVTIPRLIGHPPADNEASHLYKARESAKSEAREARLGSSMEGRNPRPGWYYRFGRFLSYHLPNQY